MSNILKLKAELDSDVPLYGALTDQQAADSLLVVDKPRPRTSMTGAEIWELTDATQFNALAAENKTQWLALCGIASFDPYGPVAVVGGNIIGGGQTATNISDARDDTITRAEEIGIGNPSNANLVGWVTDARSII